MGVELNSTLNQFVNWASQTGIGKADCDATKKLTDGASLVGLELIDHLIIGASESANGFGFVSMAELTPKTV